MYIIWHLCRLGKALINIRLMFVTLGPLPNPDTILNVAKDLMTTRLATKEDTTTTLSNDVRFVSVNYTSKFFSPAFAFFCSEYVIQMVML